MTISLTINNIKVDAEVNESLLEVARRSGAMVPSLCHHKYLLPRGACRLCLVEVTKNGRKTITTSCNYKVVDGIEVQTDTQEIKHHRKMVLQLLLGMAPDAEAIVGLARANNVNDQLFAQTKPPTNRRNCILCGLCARVCQEVVGACAITLSGRGDKKALEVPYGERVTESCIGCGACASVCPTGAIEMEAIKMTVLRKLPATKRKCRYNLMGLSPGALCSNNYDCARCEIDQRFVETCRPQHPIFAAKGFFTPKGWEE